MRFQWTPLVLINVCVCAAQTVRHRAVGTLAKLIATDVLPFKTLETLLSKAANLLPDL